MHGYFEYMTNLQYKNRSLMKQVDDFKSGETYRKKDEEYKKLLRLYHKEMKRMKDEVAQAHNETIRVRKIWDEVTDDLEKEHQAEVRGLLAEIKRLKKSNLELIRQRDEALDKYRDRNRDFYDVSVQLLEEREKNKKLIAQVNRDFENSSIPSSMQKAGRKRIPNSREKTGRKPGGQPGHQGHCRKKHNVTESHEIPAPEKYTESPDYYETGRIIRKQKVSIKMSVDVTEYTTKEYRNRITGARVHAPFPKGYVNEVNYDGTVKAFAFLLSNECNVSHAKIKKLISEMTDGAVEISVGMINGLCEEFSLKTEPEKKEIIKELMLSPVMNADFTNANVNGKSAQVLVLASPTADVALYIAKEKKGHEGVKGTPLEKYVGIVTHDHEITFYSYGTGHQECIQHNCRYLIGSIQNEPELNWNVQMHELFREMLHYRNGLGENDDLDEEKVREFEERYDRILDKAEEEYADNPPGDYYREGYNLFKRLRKYKENELLFLHDKRVPSNNSLCERLARVYKRKQKQAITLRSQNNLGYICDGLSIVYLLRTKAKGSVYQEISDIYERQKPAMFQKIKKDARA